MNKDLVASVIRATQGHGDLYGIVHDALAGALSDVSDPEARKAVLAEIDRSVDTAVFPPGSMHLVKTIMLQLRALRSEIESDAGIANATPHQAVL